MSERSKSTEIKQLDVIASKLKELETASERLDYHQENPYVPQHHRTNTSLRIPEPIFDQFFSGWPNDPEITYWFLNNSAMTIFDEVLKPEADRKTSLPLGNAFLEGELQELEQKREHAKKLLKNKIVKLDYGAQNPWEYNDEVILLRILNDDYYRKHPTETLGGITPETTYYAKYFFYEPYLKGFNDAHSNASNDHLSFPEIFYSPDESEKYLKILRDVEPPVINDENVFLLGERSKGALTAWVDALKAKSIVKKSISRQDLTSILNSKISGLNLGSDGKTLDNPGTSAYIKFFSKISRLIS